MSNLINEQIKAYEVLLTGVDGEDLGIVSTKEALRMARELKVDLVCLTLTSSPPPCNLMLQSAFKDQRNQQKHQERKAGSSMKIKEIRLSPFIADHDYETKQHQAERILGSGDAVQISVQIGKKQASAAKELLERFLKDLLPCGKKNQAMQQSGKQVSITLYPRSPL